jgi:hypothetical protein
MELYDFHSSHFSVKQIHALPSISFSVKEGNMPYQKLKLFIKEIQSSILYKALYIKRTKRKFVGTFSGSSRPENNVAASVISASLFRAIRPYAPYYFECNTHFTHFSLLKI